MYRFEEYLKEINESVDKKHLDLQASFFLVGRSDAFDSMFADMQHDSLKALFHQSTFLTCYSVFETLFKKLCILIEVQEKCRFSISDMGGNDTIKNCRIYVEKAANIKIVDQPKSKVGRYSVL